MFEDHVVKVSGGDEGLGAERGGAGVVGSWVSEE